MDRRVCILPISTKVLEGRTEIVPRGIGSLLTFKDTVTGRKPSWEEK